MEYIIGNFNSFAFAIGIHLKPLIGQIFAQMLLLLSHTRSCPPIDDQKIPFIRTFTLRRRIPLRGTHLEQTASAHQSTHPSLVSYVPCAFHDVVEGSFLKQSTADQEVKQESRQGLPPSETYMTLGLSMLRHTPLCFFITQRTTGTLVPSVISRKQQKPQQEHQHKQQPHEQQDQ